MKRAKRKKARVKSQHGAEWKQFVSVMDRIGALQAQLSGVKLDLDDLVSKVATAQGFVAAQMQLMVDEVKVVKLLIGQTRRGFVHPRNKQA